MAGEPCVHLVEADEAVSVSLLTGKETPATVLLCNWADSRPDLLANTPRWLQRNTLSGHLLRYPEDCRGCPCFKAADAARREEGNG